MKLYTQNALLAEIRRHIPAMSFDFAQKKIEPFVRVYKTATTDNTHQFRFYDEEIYNEVVNTAIRARKANPSDLNKAESDFCTLIKAINNPSVITVYTLQDAANASGENVVSTYQYLTKNVKLGKVPVEFIETDSDRRVMDRDNYLKAIEFAKQEGPKARPTKKEEPKKQQPSVETTHQLFEAKYASSQYVHKGIREKFSLSTRAKCRAFMSRLIGFIPHYEFVRGMNTEIILDLKVADKFNEAAKSSDSITDLTRKVIALFSEAPKQRLYSLTEIAETVGIPRSDHDREEVRMLAASMHIGGVLVNDTPTVFFTQSEKDSLIEVCKTSMVKATAPVPATKIEQGNISVNINGLTISLSKQDALKLAQSILNQIGG